MKEYRNSGENNILFKLAISSYKHHAFIILLSKLKSEYLNLVNFIFNYNFYNYIYVLCLSHR